MIKKERLVNKAEHFLQSPSTFCYTENLNSYFVSVHETTSTLGLQLKEAQASTFESVVDVLVRLSKIVKAPKMANAPPTTATAVMIFCGVVRRLRIDTRSQPWPS